MVSKKASKVAAEGVNIDGVRVKARRGEATDSHSLAERARREKISGRMIYLQSLVPGCDQITGKARVLDEIIKYVQLLQNHVEYLAAKVALVDLMTYDNELKTSINPCDLEIPQRECCLEPPIPLPAPLETSSVQYWSLEDSALSTSASVLLTGDQEASLITQDDGNYLLDMNDQYLEDIVNEPHELDGSWKIKAN